MIVHSSLLSIAICALKPLQQSLGAYILSVWYYREWKEEVEAEEEGGAIG